ncbi:hypothetical protein CspHIS471_0608250 [Cutaneotrichosporon sp. HIS471]|nr:hypothetical protein CspHIS471_0608250 [Cutaneotrichosporon sp. HIS471]
MSGSGDERAHKRSRQNVSQACVNCRQRKKKCDGNQPCATCLAYKDECVWGGKDDWRKPLSRSETNALRGRVEELEALVRDYKTRLELVSIQRSIPSVESSTRSPMLQKLAPPRHRDDVEDVLHDDDGTLRFFGPTSAFHRAKPSHPPSREPFHTRGEEMKWARFLPDIYITRDAHDTAVDRFFRYFSAFGQRVTPHLFYRDMELALDLPEAEISLKFVPPTIAQTIYTAGTSFLLAAAQAADKEHAAAALAHCNEMLAMLREISETWHAAAQKALILEELVAEYTNSTDAPVQAGQLWTVPLARDHPNPSPTTLDHPWSASDATLDDFIQSLFSQNTMPLGSDVDLMALLQDGMGLGMGTGQGSG